MLAGHPDALAELQRVRTQLQEFRGLARDERIVAEGYRAAEALLKIKAMDHSVPFADARAWAEQQLPGELLQHLRTRFNFSPDDATVQRVWERRPAEGLMKHAYDGASWVVLRPELRAPQDWWVSTDDPHALRPAQRPLYREEPQRDSHRVQELRRSAGGTGLIERRGETNAVCPSCLGLKGTRVLIYR